MVYLSLHSAFHIIINIDIESRFGFFFENYFV